VFFLGYARSAIRTMKTAASIRSSLTLPCLISLLWVGTSALPVQAEDPPATVVFKVGEAQAAPDTEFMQESGINPKTREMRADQAALAAASAASAPTAQASGAAWGQSAGSCACPRTGRPARCRPVRRQWV
jgi:hypothetical protein